MFVVPRLRTLIHRPAWVRRISFREVYSCGRRGCWRPRRLAAGFPQSKPRERARRQPHCLLGPIFLEAIHRMPPTSKGRQSSSRCSRGKSSKNLWTRFKTNTPTHNRSFHVKVEVTQISREVHGIPDPQKLCDKILYIIHELCNISSIHYIAYI